MSVNAVSSKCPFLARVPATFLGHAGPSLNMYGQRCPVMARMFHRAAPGGSNAAPLGKSLTLGKAGLAQLSLCVCVFKMFPTVHCVVGMHWF